ncbi:MAG: DUF499 domain-containing protein [Dehalococcoidia bacterium]|nr:DUF499 domain-containing protein [Dehalococcoidia bacterium]
MAEVTLTNKDILRRAMDLYVGAMRRFIKERLMAKHGDSWFQQGLMNSLPGDQQRQIEAEAKKRGSDRVDVLEPKHLQRLIEKQFNRSFDGVWRDYNVTSTRLRQVANARLDVSHEYTRDFSTDEVAEVLRAMVGILEGPRLPEAKEVADLRVLLLGQGRETKAPAAVEAKPAPPGEVPYWWQAAEPHDGFKDPAKIDTSLFAASLGSVAAGAAREEYSNPSVFFAGTYFTENLVRTIADVASRMQGGPGAAATELQTPFGGGKTHALLALYHLVKSPRESLAVPGVREALGDVVIPEGARIAVFDGQEYGSDVILKEDGTTVSSLWGEIAYQLDPMLYRERVQSSDGKGEAPGNAAFREVLNGASPCLILVDEIVSYLVKLKFSNQKRVVNLYAQTVQFLHDLLRQVGNIPGVCLLLTLPKSKTEWGGIDPAGLQRELGILDEIRPRAEAVVAKRTPVEDAEVYTLMSRRLFKSVDRAVAERAVDAYYGVYGPRPELFDQNVGSAEYRSQMLSAYPFHPELIDVLYKKWGTQEDFPRTRAVLQLLADVVADQWVRRPPTYAIQSSHLNLENQSIRSRVVTAGGQAGWDPVVAADIIGGDAHADPEDAARGGEYVSRRIVRGIATTILVHSFGGQASAGALPSEIRMGSVDHRLGPEYIDPVLETLPAPFWYLHREGQVLRFDKNENIERRIADTARKQPEAAVNEKLRAALSQAIGSAPGFRVLEWAGEEAIADRPELTIAVLAPRFMVAADDGKPAGRGLADIEGLWSRAGSGFREYRNPLMLIAPDQDQWRRAEDAAREVLAYGVVLGAGTKARGQGLSQVERQDLQARQKEKEDSLRTSLATAYRWVFFASDSGELASVDLGSATKNERIVNRAVERLSDLNYGAPKVLHAMSANYFQSRVLSRFSADEGKEVNLAELSREFSRRFLPLLPAREETLREAIREGMKLGQWALVIGDEERSSYQRLIEEPGTLDELTTLFDGSVSLVRGELRDLIRQDLTVARDREAPSEVVESDAAAEAPAEHVSVETAGPEVPKRHARVRIRVSGLPVAKSQNLQPYLFKVLQEVDPGTTVDLAIDVSCEAGMPEEVLEKRIVEGLDQLNIAVEWETG